MPRFDVELNAWRVKAARKEATIASFLAPGARAFRLVPEKDPSSPRYAIVSRNTYPNALPWRATWIDEHGPSGHIEAKTPQEAIDEAWRVLGPLSLAERV
jgi:hypothetical protein